MPKSTGGVKTLALYTEMPALRSCAAVEKTELARRLAAATLSVPKTNRVPPRRRPASTLVKSRRRCLMLNQKNCRRALNLAANFCQASASKQVQASKCKQASASKQDGAEI